MDAIAQTSKTASPNGASLPAPQSAPGRVTAATVSLQSSALLAADTGIASADQANRRRYGGTWKEEPPANEARLIARAGEILRAVQARNAGYEHVTGVRRAQHAKIHLGTTSAIFEVPKNLPSDLRVGLFQPGARYSATIRLSNASGKIQSDADPDLRGFALRIMTPDDAAPSLAGHDGRYQDFLLTSAERNHARNAEQFLKFAMAGAAPAWMSHLPKRIAGILSKATMALKLMRPTFLGGVGFKETIRMLRTLANDTKPVASLAEASYFSRMPMTWGDYAVKMRIVPSFSTDLASSPNSSDFLRDDIDRRLGCSAVVFDMQIQVYKNAQETPIEDVYATWTSPWVPVGTVILPKRDASVKADEKIVEGMTFNPWNTAHHRPLGIGRARASGYAASQANRIGHPVVTK